MENEKVLDKAIKVNQSGFGVSGSIYFELWSTREYTNQDIGESQVHAGYHPNGYGGPNGLKIQIEDGLVKHTWSCWASCD